VGGRGAGGEGGSGAEGCGGTWVKAHLVVLHQSHYTSPRSGLSQNQVGHLVAEGCGQTCVHAHLEVLRRIRLAFCLGFMV
jgi:hypothetical protein